MRVLVAIPCLNEEVAVGSVVLRTRAHVDEVLVVDDGSADKTAEVARLAGAQVLRHESNRGKGAAYATLWTYAREKGFDGLVCLDGDGQHDPDEIPLLLAKLAEGHDFVIGARWGVRTQMPAWRRVGKRMLDYATALGSKSGSGPILTDSQSGFRAYSKKTLSTIAPSLKGFSVESQLLMDAHAASIGIAEVPIHCRYDVEGSTETPVRHASQVLNDILVQIGVRHPLLFLGMPGLLSLAAGLGAGAWAYWVYETAQIFAIGWVLFGMLLMIVGVLGIFAGLLLNVLPRVTSR